ncbi:winged helix DNA-binding domain-containing protein [Nocardioides panacisoli]|uniref:winged helix DNA-binding domain-containing protein n=1 Tax=Nocardioides panacisoli TaxID=627624 RepID=UPI001C62B83E|nr:winged helix DNA-binding domain-containing protein [Nocardioides panacisoli]QYJ03789.1 winged helix DNA-binding domain-containing protein [Nocardioides panacisoli]
MLTTDQALRLRLAAHGLTRPLGLDPAGVVERAVALQGQDLPAVLQAIGLRSGEDVTGVRAAFDRGELVRGWPMRGTLFATTPHWLAGLLSLTAARTEQAMVKRWGHIGLDEDIVARSAEVAAEAMTDGPHTRAEMLQQWEDAGVPTTQGRGYHLIVLHSVRSLWHWGPFRDGEQCLVATPPVEVAAPEEVLADAVAGYVRARGLATVDDIAWWTKLPKGQVRRAVARCVGLAEVAVAGLDTVHLVHEEDYAALADLPPAEGVVLLPGFDEYYLGHADRSLVATPAMQQAVVPGKNGVFRPLVVLDGRVVATWRNTKKGAELVDLVEQVPSPQRAAIDAALAEVATG